MKENSAVFLVQSYPVRIQTSARPETALFLDIGVMLKFLSSEASEHSDTIYMPVVKIRACLDLGLVSEDSEMASFCIKTN